MASLFYEYESLPSVTVSSRPDGTRLVAISDTQYPFVDQPLLEAVNRFISDFQPNDLVYNGDILDMYEISEFDKRPQRAFNIEAEEAWARDLLAKHAALSPGAQQFWVDGNHEERLTRYIWKHAGPISNHVKTLPEVLGLDKLGAAYVPYGKHVDYLSFVFTHGETATKTAAAANLEAYRSSGVSGHTHRMSSASRTDMKRKSHTWFEMGHLCRDDLEYMKSHPNWQAGFLWGEVYDGALHPQLARVIEGRSGRGFYAGGKFYRVG